MHIRSVRGAARYATRVTFHSTCNIQRGKKIIYLLVGVHSRTLFGNTLEGSVSRCMIDSIDVFDYFLTKHSVYSIR